MNTPEESTKSEDLNEYTPNRLVDTISLTLAKLQKKSTFASDIFL